MKKYILMGQIAGIGGWQLYMDARNTYLSDLGIKVYLISISNEKTDIIKLKSFQQSEKLCIPEVHLPPITYTQKQRNNILSRVVSFVDYQGTDDIFIESTDMPLSMWGELLAKDMHAVNFSYLLHSHIENVSKDMQKFFAFKYEKKMLAGMSELTLPDLFNGYMDIDPGDKRRIFAVPRDSLTDEDILCDIIAEIISFKKSGGKVIAYFGNLTKPHFAKLCDVIRDYAKRHEHDKFLFLSIGSSSQGKAEKLQKKIELSALNCICKNVAALYPVPKKIFREMNVCIASWGCSDDAARAGALTVRLLDDVNTTVQGIMGITLTGADYYLKPPSEQQLEEFLDDILYKNKYTVEDYTPLGEVKDYRKYEKMQDEIMRPFEQRDCPLQFYDISQIKYMNRRASMEKFLNHLFGVKATLGIIDIMKAILVKNI